MAPKRIGKQQSTMEKTQSPTLSPVQHKSTKKFQPTEWFHSLQLAFSKTLSLNGSEVGSLIRATRPDEWSFLEIFISEWHQHLEDNSDSNKENKRRKKSKITYTKASAIANPCFALYLSGPPGTGKSAMINAYFDKYSSSERKSQPTYIYINCVQFSDAKKLIGHLWNQFIIRKSRKPTAILLDRMIEDLVEYQSSNGIILVLDELDAFSSNHYVILAKLLTLSNKQIDPWMIIGVANSMNLIDEDYFKNTLTFKGLNPTFLHMNAFSDALLCNAIIGRALCTGIDLKESIENGLIDKGVLEICVKKMGNASGDIRKVLDLMLLVVDTAEQEYLESQLKADETEEAGYSKGALIKVKHVQLAFKKLNGEAVISQEKDASLPQQILLQIFLDNQKAAIPFDRLYELFCDYLKTVSHKNSMKIPSQSRTEVKDSLTLMENLGWTCPNKASKWKLSMDPYQAKQHISCIVRSTGS